MNLSLTDEQRAVVTGPRGVFVSAAAGSGKTRVLTARFLAAVLGERGTPAAMDEVLTVTFTDKAAGEIAERVRGALLREGASALARRTDDAWISTIHGMCTRLLRRHAFDAGIDPHFVVCTEVERALLAEEAFEHAARARLAADDTLGTLVAELGIGPLRDEVLHLHARVRSFGAHAADLALPALPTAGVFLAAAGRLDALAHEFDALKPTATTEANALASRDAAQVLTALAHSLAPEHAALTIEALHRCKVAQRGSEDVKLLAAEAKDLIAAASAEAATIAAQPYARALRELLVAFEERFAELKAARGVLDFEDLELFTAELLERRSDIAQECRRRFAEVMIDEFQDTNALQLRIVELIGGDGLLTVGDDKQSIYRFRHADVDVFRGRAAAAPHRRHLRANYRTHPAVLAVVNELFDAPEFFAGDFTRLDAKGPATDAWPEGEPRVRLLALEAGELRARDALAAEAHAIARHLAALRERGVPQRDMVLLLRAMAGRAETFAQALRTQGFNVYVASGGTYFDRPEVEDVLALVRVLDNPLDDEALLRVLAGRLVGLSDVALALLAHAAGRSRLWAQLAAAAAGDGPALPPADAAALAHAVAVITGLRARRGERRIAQLVHEACELLDYDLTLFASGPDGPRAWANVLKLARLADAFEDAAPGDLAAFLAHVEAQRLHGDAEQATLVAEGIDAVRIMSIHSAKGLEFPVVVVGDLGSHRAYRTPDVLLRRSDPPLLSLRLPKPLSPTGAALDTPLHAHIAEADAAAEDAEAKRLFYVACTRAKQALVLSGRASLAEDPAGASLFDRVRRTLAALGTPVPPHAGEYALSLAGAPLAVTVAVAGPPEPPAVPPAICERPDAADARAAAAEAAAAATTTAGAGPPAVPPRISYSGLAAYERCPLSFHVTHVLGLRGLPHTDEQQPDPRAFGSAFHAAVRTWRGDAASLPDDARLTAVLLAGGAAPAELPRLRAALDALASAPVAAEVAAAECLHPECPVMLPVGGSLLVGSIDLLAWRDGAALLVDYKTGAGELAPDDARDRYALQAGCYALAALRAGAAVVEVVFVEVERGGRETRFRFAPADAPALEAPVLAALERMAAGRFPPLAAYEHATCAACPALGSLCPVTPPGRRAV